MCVHSRRPTAGPIPPSASENCTRADSLLTCLIMSSLDVEVIGVQLNSFAPIYYENANVTLQAIEVIIRLLELQAAQANRVTERNIRQVH